MDTRKGGDACGTDRDPKGSLKMKGHSCAILPMVEPPLGIR